MQRFPRRVLVLLLAALVLGACDGGRGDSSGEDPTRGEDPTTSPVITEGSPGASRSEDIEPPPDPRPPPPTEGPKTDTCVDAWVTPPEGDELRDVALRVMWNETGWKGTFEVTDLRYFTGPESPPDPDKGYLRVVQRWYVKGYVRRDPALQGRFLVERRRFGSGLSAVAPYDSKGWRSPDWIGFQLDTADPTPRVYAGLPGEWAGVPYDFVEGGEGIRFPGLPAEVTGCLDGT